MDVNRGCVESARAVRWTTGVPSGMGWSLASRHASKKGTLPAPAWESVACRRATDRIAGTYGGARYATYVRGLAISTCSRDALPLRACRGVIPFFGNCWRAGEVGGVGPGGVVSPWASSGA